MRIKMGNLRRILFFYNTLYLKRTEMFITFVSAGVYVDENSDK
jgi:hypothetical protein